MGKSKKVLWGYGIGNGLLGLIPTMVNTYYSIFLSGAAGINAKSLAMILTVSGIIEVISIPCVSAIIQKANLKMGKFRPWILMAGIAVSVLRWLSFTDVGLTGGSKVLWFGIMHISSWVIFNLCYGAYMGLIPKVAYEAQDRIKVASIQTQSSAVWAILFSVSSVSLIAVLGRGNDIKGYSGLALIISVLVLFTSFYIFSSTKTLDVPEADKGAAGGVPVNEASLWDMVRLTFNKPMLLYLIGSVGRTTASLTIAMLTAYYYTYVLGDMKYLTWYLTLSNVFMLVGATIAPYITKMVKSSKNTYALGLGVYAVSLVVAFFTGNSAIAFTVCLSVGYMGWSIAHSSDPAVYSFIGDYVEWKHQKDIKAFLMSLLSLAIKIGVACAGAVVGWGLVAIGFDANNVTDGAVSGLRYIICLLPAAIMAVGLVAMFCYPLTEKKMSQYQQEIRDRAGNAPTMEGK